MQRKSLVELLQPVRLRLTMFTVSRLALSGLLGGSAGGLLLLGASRLWPILHVRLLFLMAAGAGLAIGAIAGLWKRASLRDAARAMDRLDTEDAISTALDGLLRQGEQAQPIVMLQREAATAAAEQYVSGLRAKLPWPAWRSWRSLVYGAAAVWVVTAALLVMPNPLDERAEALAQAKERLEALEREADKLAELTETAELPEEAKQELLAAARGAAKQA